MIIVPKKNYIVPKNKNDVPKFKMYQIKIKIIEWFTEIISKEIFIVVFHQIIIIRIIPKFIYDWVSFYISAFKIIEEFIKCSSVESPFNFFEKSFNIKMIDKT